jgi:peptidoglycan/LPS O-acetylase OafA/YrhL
MVSDMAGVLIAAAYGTACAAAVKVLWSGSRRWLALIPMVGIGILVAIIVLQIFPLPSGWELIAPTVAIVALIVGAAVGRKRGERAQEALSQ